jgi:hypothetical protein
MKFYSLLLVLLYSCSSALVPETSDPNLKLKYSFELVSNKRGIAAEKLINEACQIFETRADLDGLGRCYYAKANLYRSNASHDKYKLPNNEMAGESYFKAAEFYYRLQNYKGYADSMILGALFHGLNNKVEKNGVSCKKLAEAKKRLILKSKEAANEIDFHQKKMTCL